MHITVAICTWNRAELLATSLENMLHIKTDDSFSWELIIVNNNSTDNTDEVIAKFSDRLPIKRISEPTPGLSNARNAAVHNAGGDYIVWTDDDVLVDENWLLAYAEAFRKYPEAGVFGGPVEPWFEGEPPKWLAMEWEAVAYAFAVRNLGDQEFAFLAEETSKFPFGANFAIKKKVQQLALYDPKLGLNAGKIILGEETAVIRKILLFGYSGWWIPDAKVKHWLPKERQTLKYIQKYYAGHGETHVRRGEVVSVGVATLFGRPRWLLRKMIELQLKYYYQRITKTPDVWIDTLIVLSICKGQLLALKNS